MKKVFKIISLLLVALFIVGFGVACVDTDSSNDNSNNVPPAPKTTPDEDEEIPSDSTVYITKTGEKYHSSGCRYLSRSCIPILLSVAKAQGYTPCSVCDPPQ